MKLLGALRLGVYYGVWIYGCLSIPIACLALYFGHVYPLYLLVAYYSFRFVKPAVYWPEFKQAFNLNTAPYCNSQRFVFEDGASAPKENHKVMLAVAPHGILTLGWSFMMSSDDFFQSRVKWLVAESLFYIPFISDFVKWADCQPCTRQQMLATMAKGENVALLPGGFQEATLYERGKYKIYINNRKGFIKFALQFGYKVVPCFVFGEELTYWTLNAGQNLRLWLNKYNIPGTIFIGKFLFLPDNDIDVTVVIGKALELPHLETPTDDEVEKYHDQYVKAVQELFERNKKLYGDPSSKLELF